jgi:hypothetical protein
MSMPARCARTRAGGLVVAGEHGQLAAGSAEPGDHIFGFGAQLISHRDRANDPAIDFDEHGGGPRGLHLSYSVGQFAGVELARPAQAHRTAAGLAGQPLPAMARTRWPGMPGRPRLAVLDEYHSAYLHQLEREIRRAVEPESRCGG